MEAGQRLQKAFEYIRKTFFPRWDKKQQWIVRLNHNLPSMGRCNHETKSIEIKNISENDGELHLLLIHEICHVWYTGHKKTWQGRLLKAAKKAKEIGNENLSEMIKKEVELYIKARKITAEDIYNRIYEIITTDAPTVKYNDLIKYMASQHGQYPEEFEKYFKKCRKVYEEARNEVRLRKEAQALMKKRLLAE